MILQPFHGQLILNNGADIMVDYQSRYASTIISANRDIPIHHAVNLAKIARTFNIPTLLTTIAESRLGSPVLSRLQEIFSDQKRRIRRDHGLRRKPLLRDNFKIFLAFSPRIFSFSC
jgi:hypothetical protein